MLSKEQRIIDFLTVKCKCGNEIHYRLRLDKIKDVKECIQQLENKQQKVIEKLKKDKIKNNEFEFMPLQIEKAYNNYYKLGKIDEIDEILEIMRGEE